MPSTPRHHPGAKPGPRARVLRWILAVPLALAALAALALAGGVFVGEGQLRARVQRLEGASGSAVRVGAVDLRLDRGVRVRDLAIGLPLTSSFVADQGAPPPDAGPLQATIREVRTDLGLVGLANGERRPRTVSVSGLRLALTVDDEGVRGLDTLRDALRGGAGQDKASGSKAAGDAQAVSAVSIALDDAHIAVSLDLADVPFPSLSLEGLTAQVSLGADGSLTLEGTAQLAIAGHRLQVAAAVQTGAEARATLTLAEPLLFPLTLAGRSVVVALSGLSRDGAAGTTTITGLSLGTERARVDVERVVIRDSPGLRPDPGAVREVVLHGVFAAVPGRRAHVTRVEIELGRALSGPLPVEPREVTLFGVEAELGALPAAFGIRSPKVEAQAVEVRLVSDLLGQLDPADPLAVIESVALRGPKARLTLTDQAGVGELRGAALLDHLLSQAREARGTAALVGEDDGSAAANPAATNSTAVTAGRMRKAILERLSRLRVAVEDGEMTATDATGQVLLLVAGVGARVERPDPEHFRFSMSGRVARGKSEAGSFQLSIDTNAEGQLESASGHVAGRDFAHMVSRMTKHVTVPPDARIDLRFAYTPPGPGRTEHQLSGTARFNEFGFHHWRVAHEPLTGLEGELEFAVTHDPASHHTVLAVSRARLGEMTLQGSADIVRRPDDGLVFDFRLKMPEQDCGKVAASIPPQLMPRLTGLQTEGRMAFEVALYGDMDEPKAVKLEVEGNMDRCRVSTLGDQIDIGALRGPFVHHPIEPKKGRREDIRVGRGTGSWVRSSSLPRLVKAAAIVTEDRGWMRHEGVRWELVLRALRINLMHKRFVYGGSTITQQLVKNLYLTREKTLSRKLEELIISWQMERELTKDEILTIYLNVIEYGPGIYGVKRASRFYFGKQPWRLSPLEAAFIMGLKPFPRAGFGQWEKGQLNSYWIKRVKHVLAMMHSREKAITKDEVLAAAPYQPRFRRHGESFSSGRRYVKPTGVDEGVLGTSPTREGGPSGRPSERLPPKPW